MTTNIDCLQGSHKFFVERDLGLFQVKITCIQCRVELVISYLDYKEFKSNQEGGLINKRENISERPYKRAKCPRCSSFKIESQQTLKFDGDVSEGPLYHVCRACGFYLRNSEAFFKEKIDNLKKDICPVCHSVKMVSGASRGLHDGFWICETCGVVRFNSDDWG